VHDLLTGKIDNLQGRNTMSHQKILNFYQATCSSH